MTAQLHLAIDALALQLLLQCAQRLVDIIVANDDLHKSRSTPLAGLAPGQIRLFSGVASGQSLRKKRCSPRSSSSRRWPAHYQPVLCISRASENQPLNRYLFPSYDESSLWCGGLPRHATWVIGG